MDGKVVSIIDPETSIKYDLVVSDSDYVRAHEDIEFATLLLQHAIMENSEKNVVPTTFQDCIPSTSKSVMREGETCTVYEKEIDCVIEKKHIWRYSETIALIKSMETHYENLSHHKKRKYVYENICNDLLSQSISTNANLCQIKWKSLLRSYNQAKDNQNKTGRGPSRFQFFDEIDAIVGKKPTAKCTHTLDSSTLGTTVFEVNINKDSESNSNTSLEFDIEANSLKRVPSPPQLEPKTEHKKRKYISKIEHEQNKSRRHAERMEIEKRKLEIEEQKIDLLKKYLEMKNASQNN